MKNLEYKYRIKEKLESLPYEQYRIAKRTLPKALGITKRTFERYLYTRLDDKYSIPSDHLASLAAYFKCTMEELLSYKPLQITKADLNKLNVSKIARKLGLVK